jgi:hypothetical protein
MTTWIGAARVEIAYVLPGLFDDPGAVVVPRSLMAGDHSPWFERLVGNHTMIGNLTWKTRVPERGY